MSSLYKLSITGIRSFSPKENEIIEFGAPLTLICGQNGCGKTTIIECLKYATTGDLPPNSKGGAFVNDPAIADRLMVNAEIKLGFISVDGKSMTATRCMQLTRKRAGRGKTGTTNTFKTLEGQLAVISQGRKTAISTKNNELDTRVPQYLGASRAILDYVIFCHQEESLWPLSEASVLKKRFDDIFEALKFTKVLDNLKIIRKDMQTDIKLIEQSVQHLNVDKGRATRIKERLRDSEAQADKYSEEIAQLTAEIETLEKQADDLFHSNQSFQETLSEYHRLSMVYETTNNTYKWLGGSIDRLPDADEDLTYKLANFSKIHEENTEMLEQKEIELVDTENVLNDLVQTANQLTRSEGILYNKREEYEANLSRVTELGQRFLHDMNVDVSVGDAKLEAQYEKCRASHREIASELERLLSERMQAQRNLENTLLFEDQKKQSIQGEIASCSGKIKELNARIATLADSENDLNSEKLQLEALKEKLERARANAPLKELQDKIESDNVQLHVQEASLEDVMKKIGTANKQADVLSKLEMLKESTSVKEKALQNTIKAHADSFTGATGQKLDLSSAGEILDKLWRSQDESFRKTQSSVNKLNGELLLKKGLLESEEKEAATLKEKATQQLSQIETVIDRSEFDSYDSVVEELLDDYNAARHNLSTFEVTKSFKVKAIEIAKDNKCCTLCNRGFDGQGLDKFIKDIEMSINAQAAKQLQEDVDKTKKDLDTMSSMRVPIADYKRMANAVDAATDRMNKFQMEISELESQLASQQSALEDASSRRDSLMELKHQVTGMTRISDEVNELKNQMAKLQRDLEDFGISSTSMGELQKKQLETNQEVKRLRNAIAENTEEKNIQQRALTRLDGDVKDKELVISNLKHSMNDVINCKQRVGELKSRIGQLEADRQKVDNNIESCKRKTEKQVQALEQAIKEQETRESEAKKEAEMFTKYLDELKGVKQAISRFEEHDAPEVDKNARELKEVQKKVVETKDKRKQLEQEMKELQKKVNEASSIQRNIQENLEFRKAEKQLDEVKAQMSELDVEKAEQEKESYQAMSRELREQIAEANGRYAGKMGEVKQIKEQVHQLKKELSTEFKDVDKLYHQEWIKLQTNRLVSNDLQTYSQALDNAIMKYHSTKMDEINRILRELWNQTYRGTDIDRIEIKCDVNNQTRGRSYDYRVVMYKKSSELDMRGRCSAGQKVLTSILIRLALAECFGTNCGMIALDEPTTNLDAENAESLAMALNNIIEFRKDQKNFQLIVITHDEKFLSHIHGDQYVDNFYRITRDESQNSIIKSLPIHLMQDD